MTMSETDYERGYNTGYQAGRRGSSPRPQNRINRARYSERVHERLLEVHGRRWEEMHAHYLKHGRDAVYHELRASMIEASRAVSRYVASTRRRSR